MVGSIVTTSVAVMVGLVVVGPAKLAALVGWRCGGCGVSTPPNSLVMFMLRMVRLFGVRCGRG